MRVLVWHVHGAYSLNLMHGGHDYLVPVASARERRQTPPAWAAHPNILPMTPPELRAAEVDVVVLQHLDHLREAERLLGRRPGTDVPAVYLEHNTPGGHVCQTRHPLADQDRIPIVHVTHFNHAFWDCGRARVLVVEHGVADPGHRFSGEVPAAAVIVNEPLRRWRAVGADLLSAFTSASPLDVYGMKVVGLADRLCRPRDVVREHEDLPQERMHAAVARRRVYLHPNRWTSLGLSLIEAMFLGLPVVALAATAAPDAVPSDAGVVSTRIDVLRRAVAAFVHDRELAAATGARARAAARERFGLDRFLADWDHVFKEVTS